MKISEAIWRFTHRTPITWAKVWGEIIELWEALEGGTIEDVHEELCDVVFFIQAKLWWVLTLDMPVWPLAKVTVDKLEKRTKFWPLLYVACGIREDTMHSSSNYKRVEKVIDRLGVFGVPERTARIAYNLVVKPMLPPTYAHLLKKV